MNLATSQRGCFDCLAAANPDLIQSTDETEKTCWFYKYAIDSPENHENGKKKKDENTEVWKLTGEKINEKNSKKQSVWISPSATSPGLKLLNKGLVQTGAFIACGVLLMHCYWKSDPWAAGRTHCPWQKPWFSCKTSKDFDVAFLWLDSLLYPTWGLTENFFKAW